jgi:DNA-binding CsgD family transcriptional regulator
MTEIVKHRALAVWPPGHSYGAEGLGCYRKVVLYGYVAEGELSSMPATKRVAQSTELDSVQISEMLDLVYEGPLERRPWQAFVDKLREATNATRVWIQLYRPEDAEHDISITASTHPDSKMDWPLLRDTYHRGYLESDPLKHFKMMPGEVLTLDDYRGSAFRDELLLPMGINHYIRTFFSEPDGMCGWLQMLGHRSTAVFDKTKALFLLDELLPHLGRALRWYVRFLVDQGEKAVYQKAISHLAFGTIVLDGKGNILDANRIATALVDKYPEIDLANGRLVLSNQEINAELQAAIGAAIWAKRQSKQEEYVELVRLRSSCGALIAFLILPTPFMVLYQGDHTPNVIVYMCDLEQHIGDQHERKQSAEKLVAKLFKLSKSEARIAVLLADGLTMSEAAADMGITEGSARSYTKRIYEKTDIKRQSDLIRLIYKSGVLLG